MNDQTHAPEPHPSRIGHTSTSGDGENEALRLAAVVGLGFAALAVLALAGGTVNLTSTGFTLTVNARH